MINIQINVDTVEEAQEAMRQLLIGTNEAGGVNIDLSGIPSILKEQNPLENVVYTDDHAKDPAVKQGTALDANSPELDADDYPWDKRIHSTAHSRNENGTWKVLRRPKVFGDDAAAWEAFIKRTRAELRGENPEEPVDDPKDVFGDNENPAAGMEGDSTTTTTKQETTITDEKKITTVGDVPVDFPTLMKFITSNNDKISVANVGVICTNFGLADLPALMKPENADLIPMIYNSALDIIANGVSDET